MVYSIFGSGRRPGWVDYCIQGDAGAGSSSGGGAEFPLLAILLPGYNGEIDVEKFRVFSVNLFAPSRVSLGAEGQSPELRVRRANSKIRIEDAFNDLLTAQSHIRMERYNDTRCIAGQPANTLPVFPLRL